LAGFILPGLAAMFLWAYSSILFWTEQPRTRHAHSTNGRPWQAN